MRRISPGTRLFLFNSETDAVPPHNSRTAIIMGKIRKHRLCFCRTSFFCKQQVKFAAAGKREKKIYSVQGDCNDDQNRETDIAGNDRGWIEKNKERYRISEA